MNMIGMLMNQKTMRMSAGDSNVELTCMEMDCLTLTANGFRPNEIGAKLDITEEQVATSFLDAQRKLGARNRLHAIGIAVSQGLIGIDSKA